MDEAPRRLPYEAFVRQYYDECCWSHEPSKGACPHASSRATRCPCGGDTGWPAYSSNASESAWHACDAPCNFSVTVTACPAPACYISRRITHRWARASRETCFTCPFARATDSSCRHGASIPRNVPCTNRPREGHRGHHTQQTPKSRGTSDTQTESRETCWLSSAAHTSPTFA